MLPDDATRSLDLVGPYSRPRLEKLSMTLFVLKNWTLPRASHSTGPMSQQGDRSG